MVLINQEKRAAIQQLTECKAAMAAQQQESDMKQAQYQHALDAIVAQNQVQKARLAELLTIKTRELAACNAAQAGIDAINTQQQQQMAVLLAHNMAMAVKLRASETERATLMQQLATALEKGMSKSKGTEHNRAAFQKQLEAQTSLLSQSNALLAEITANLRESEDRAAQGEQQLAQCQSQLRQAIVDNLESQEEQAQAHSAMTACHEELRADKEQLRRLQAELEQLKEKGHAAEKQLKESHGETANATQKLDEMLGLCAGLQPNVKASKAVLNTEASAADRKGSEEHRLRLMLSQCKVESKAALEAVEAERKQVEAELRTSKQAILDAKGVIHGQAITIKDLRLANTSASTVPKDELLEVTRQLAKTQRKLAQKTERIRKYWAEWREIEVEFEANRELITTLRQQIAHFNEQKDKAAQSKQAPAALWARVHSELQLSRQQISELTAQQQAAAIKKKGKQAPIDWEAKVSGLLETLEALEATLAKAQAESQAHAARLAAAQSQAEKFQNELYTSNGRAAKDVAQVSAALRAKYEADLKARP
jgi:chromosome segregation ATPase